MRPIALLFSAAALLLTTHAGSVCYGQTGNQDPTILVCDPTAGASSCCAYGDYCYSNGLCQSPNTTVGYPVFGIHGCTDPNVKTGECAPFARCISKGVGVTACDTDTYCCYGLSGCDCSNSTQTFTLPAGTIITSLPAKSVMSLTSTASPSTSTSISASTSTTAAATSSNNGVAIGVGVGVSAAVLLFIGAGIGFWLWRRRRNAVNAVAADKERDDGYGHTVNAKYGDRAPPGYSAAEQRDSHYANELAAGHTSEIYTTVHFAQLDVTSRAKSPVSHERSELA